MKLIGKILLAIGIISIIGFVGTDDVEIMRGMNPPIESLIIKLLFGIILAATGAILIKGSDMRGRRKEL